MTDETAATPAPGFAGHGDAPKVGMLAPSLATDGGGVATAVRGLSQALARRTDLRLRLFTGRIGDDGVDVPSTAYRVIGPSEFGFAPALIDLLAGADCDLLHVHGLWMYPSMAVQRWARAPGPRPYLVSPHGMLEPWALRRSAWKKRLAARWFERGHLMGASVLQALNLQELAAIRGFGLTNPVAVIPNGVGAAPAGMLGVPDWAGSIPQGASSLLYLGRLHPKKNLPALLHGWMLARRAAAAAAESWWLIIAGWDQQGCRRRLIQECRRLGLENSVILADPQWGKAKWASLAAADALILPSLSEGLPMTILEAWTQGLPVLMTRHCHLDEGLKVGAALPIGAAATGISRGLQQLFEMGLRDRLAMGQRGVALVRRHYLWEHIAATFAEVYAWQLGAGPAPSCIVLS